MKIVSERGRSSNISCHFIREGVGERFDLQSNFPFLGLTKFGYAALISSRSVSVSEEIDFAEGAGLCAMIALVRWSKGGHFFIILV